MNPWRRLACHIAPILTALVFSYILVSLFGDRFHPRDILDLHIEPAEVRQGQVATLVSTAIDDRQCTGIVHRWIIDAKGGQHGLADMPVYFNNALTRGAQFQFMREFNVPVSAALGIAVYHSESIRWCNVFQQYIWPMTDRNKVTFVVIAGATGAIGPAGPAGPAGAAGATGATGPAGPAGSMRNSVEQD